MNAGQHTFKNPELTDSILGFVNYKDGEVDEWRGCCCGFLYGVLYRIGLKAKGLINDIGEGWGGGWDLSCWCH